MTFEKLDTHIISCQSGQAMMSQNPDTYVYTLSGNNWDDGGWDYKT